MRSSNKSRSRNKNNRNRNVGNIVNRVFDSAGPDGKVRGTPQQIIEKYQGLAHDAQLSNDPVAAENFRQHAEHYTRMLSEAQREVAERQQAADAQRQQRSESQNRDDQPQDNDNGSSRGNGNGQRASNGATNDGVFDSGIESGLVETPESVSDQPDPAAAPVAPARKPRGRPRKTAPAAEVTDASEPPAAE